MQSQSTLFLHQNYKQKVKDTISHLVKEGGSMIANNEDIFLKPLISFPNTI